MKNIILNGAIAFLIVFSAGAKESAAFSINVSPPSERLSIPPGETISGTITVENKSDDSMDMRAYTEDWVYTENGGKEFMPAGTAPLSCAKWITLHPQKFHIEPHSRAGIQYTITVPPDSTGGHYAVIFFESIVNESEAARGNMTLSFAGRLGTIIYQETKERIKREGNIAAFTCGRPDQNGPLAINITLKNEGNTHIIAQGVMNIIDKDGNVFGRKEIGPINTLPGDTREYSTEWMGELDEGTYDAIVTLDTGLDFPLVAETVLRVGSSGAIEKFDVASETNPPAFNILVSNTGNLNVKITGSIDIFDEEGAVVMNIPLKNVLVAPNSKKEIQEKADRTLLIGKYNAKALIMFGDKELTKEGEFFIK